MQSEPSIHRYHAFQLLSKVGEEDKFYRKAKWMQLVEVLNKYVIGMKVKDFKSNQVDVKSKETIKLGRLAWDKPSLQKVCTHYLDYEQPVVKDVFLMSYSPQKTDTSHLPVFHFYFENEIYADKNSAYNQSLLLLFREDFYQDFEEMIAKDLTQLYELLPAKMAYHCFSPLSSTVKNEEGQIERHTLSYSCHAKSTASLEMEDEAPGRNWEQAFGRK